MTALEYPDVLFAPAGQHRVAYRMSGRPPPDVVVTPGLWSHMGLSRDDPGHVDFRLRMELFCRLIAFDSLGTGLSDRPVGGLAVDQWSSNFPHPEGANGGHHFQKLCAGRPDFRLSE